MLKELVNHESSDQESYYDINERHPEINESLRARLIDWILHCTKICDMEEKNIFFVTVKLMDLYYKRIAKFQSKRGMQLTAVSALFISSKMFQI